MANFEGEHLVHPILTKGGLRLQSFLSLCHGGLGDDLRPAVLAVLVLLHGNGNLWPIPWDSASALAPLHQRGNCYSAHAGARLALVVMAHVIRTSRGEGCIDISTPQEPILVSRSFQRSWRCPPHEAWPLARVLDVDAEDGPYQAAEWATPWAAGRQVWVPRFPGRRQT
jgi:hypothetical protein